ncbi:MAG TPA: hypothetical protein VGP93_01300 [Polyangiaceae bacterium]|nr:hypothetical protein [Polyangiaceae bacterium]
MLWSDILVALLVALVFSGVFASVVRWGGPHTGRIGAAGLLIFFCLMFLATWAGGLWMPPLGPPAWGVSWLNFALVGLVMAAVIAAAGAPGRPRRARAGATALDQSDTAGLGLTIFFWVAVVILLLMVIAAYAT